MKNRGESTVDVIILITLLTLAVIACFFLDVYWGWFSLCFAGALGLWEGIRVMNKGKTLTQKFAQMKADYPLRAWLFIIALNAFFIYLNIHLWVLR